MNTTIHQAGTRVTAVTPAGHAITGRVESHVQVNEFGDVAYTVRDDATGFTFTAAADKVQAVSAPSPEDPRPAQWQRALDMYGADATHGSDCDSGGCNACILDDVHRIIYATPLLAQVGRAGLPEED